MAVIPPEYRKHIPQYNYKFVRIKLPIKDTKKEAKIYYIAEGEGRPMFLLHGWGATSYTWRYNIQPFSKNYRVIALDMLGAGKSDICPDFGYEFEQYLEAAYASIISICSAEGFPARELILVGNSLGGLLSWLLAANHPEMVSQLILIDAGGYDQELPLLYRLALRMKPTKAFPRLFAKKIIEWTLRIVYYNHNLISRDMIDEYEKFANEPARARVTQLILKNLLSRRKEASEVLKRLQKIKIPTLIIFGEEDRLVPAEYGHYFHNEIRDSELYYIPCSGHSPQEETPLAVNELILNFLHRRG